MSQVQVSESGEGEGCKRGSGREGGVWGRREERKGEGREREEGRADRKGKEGM